MNSDRNSNVLQDGKWLVVPLEGAVFPNRCIKTNEPVDAADFIFEGELFRTQIKVPKSAGRQAAETAARLVFGRGGEGVVELLTKRSIRLRIGLSKKRQAFAKFLWWLGVALVIIGPILGVVLSALIGNARADAYQGTFDPLAIAGLAFGMGLMVVGLVLFGVSTMSNLRIIRSDGKYIWLEGAGTEFLKSLDESPEKWNPKGIFRS